MNDKELAAHLDTWFSTQRTNYDVNKFTRSLVWKVLKKELTKLGHWKGLPRGNPNAFENVNSKGSWD